MKGHGGGSLREEADAALRAASQPAENLYMGGFVY